MLVGRAEQQRIAKLLAVWNKAKFSRFGFNFEYAESEQKSYLSLVYSESFKRKPRGARSSPGLPPQEEPGSAGSHGFPQKKAARPQTKDLALEPFERSAGQSSSGQQARRSFSFEAQRSAEKGRPGARGSGRPDPAQEPIPELAFEHEASELGLGTGSSLTSKQQPMPRNSLASQLADSAGPERSARRLADAPQTHTPRPRSLSRPLQGSSQHLNLDLLDESLGEQLGQQSSNPLRASKKSSEDASERGSVRQKKLIRIAKKSPRSQPPEQPGVSKASEAIIVIEDLSKADA